MLESGVSATGTEGVTVSGRYSNVHYKLVVDSLGATLGHLFGTTAPRTVCHCEDNDNIEREVAWRDSPRAAGSLARPLSATI